MPAETIVQHTPGPWWPLTDPVIAADGHLIYTVLSGKRSPIAVVELFNPKDGAEIEANTRLIAAAPELLAALEAVMRVLPSLRTEQPGFPNGPFDAAKAAIVKARGQQ